MTTYGCHNREIHAGYWRIGRSHTPTADNGQKPEPFDVAVWIPHNMSKDCRSDSFGDPRCQGCKWQQAEPFAAPVDGSGGIAK